MRYCGLNFHHEVRYEKALVTNCLSPKKTQTLKKLHNGTIITWYWYHIVMRIGTKQPYVGIKIFGQWYQSNLALVPNNTRVKFPRLKMTKLPPFESPKRLKRLVAKTSSVRYTGIPCIDAYLETTTNKL